MHLGTCGTYVCGDAVVEGDSGKEVFGFYLNMFLKMEV